MRSRAWRSAAAGLLVAFASHLATGQSNQEWTAYKQKCGIPAGMAYNDWVSAGSKCNAGSAAPVGTGSAEQLGTTLGNIGGDMIITGVQGLFRPAPPKLAPQIDASQQRALAAQQLNNSGIYLLNRKPRDYAGAINEFQKALDQTPNDAVIAANLRYAKQLQKESLAAGQTSNMLGSVLGSPSTSSKTDYSSFTGASPNVFNQVNLDPNVVDFRGMFRNNLPTTALSYLPAANANVINAILTGSDANVVDMRGAAKTSIDPKQIQTQINGIFGNAGTPTAAQPSATAPKPAAEKQTKDQINDLFSKPDPPPHN
jgi:hypothetical protein